LQIYLCIARNDSKDITGDLLADFDHQDNTLGRLLQGVPAYSTDKFYASLWRMIDQPVLHPMLVEPCYQVLVSVF